MTRCASSAGTPDTSAPRCRSTAERRPESARPRSRPRRRPWEENMRTERHAQCALAVTTAVFALAGCTSFSPDGGFGDVEKIAKERLGKDVTWQRTDEEAARARDEVQRLLASELSSNDAVQIA